MACERLARCCPVQYRWHPRLTRLRVLESKPNRRCFLGLVQRAVGYLAVCQFLGWCRDNGLWERRRAVFVKDTRERQRTVQRSVPLFARTARTIFTPHCCSEMRAGSWENSDALSVGNERTTYIQHCCLQMRMAMTAINLPGSLCTQSSDLLCVQGAEMDSAPRRRHHLHRKPRKFGAVSIEFETR